MSEQIERTNERASKRAQQKHTEKTSQTSYTFFEADSLCSDFVAREVFAWNIYLRRD